MKLLVYSGRMALPIALVAIAACSQDGVQGVIVKGAVVENGVPYASRSPQGGLVMVLFAVDDAGKVQAGHVADLDWSTGQFIVYGPTEEGIPVGKYQIRISHRGPNGGPSFLPEKLDGAETPLTVELPKSLAQPLKVEVGKAPSVSW